MIKPAYSVSFLLSINIFVWQNVLYFPKDPSRYIVYPLIFMLRIEMYDLERKNFILYSCKIYDVLIQNLLKWVTILMYNYVKLNSC